MACCLNNNYEFFASKSSYSGKFGKIDYMFNKRCQQFNLDRTEEFFRLAGKLYNPLAENQVEIEREEDEEDLTEEMLE